MDDPLHKAKLAKLVKIKGYDGLDSVEEDNHE